MTAPTHTDERIHDHIKDLNSQIARCDSKASLLLALTGTSLAGVVSVAANARPGAAALTVGSLGAALLFTATMLLLAVVRPNTTGPGWPRWPAASTRASAGPWTAPGPDSSCSPSPPSWQRDNPPARTRHTLWPEGGPA